jgi:uncharacterized membrane protein (DUF4010 family)
MDQLLNYELLYGFLVALGIGILVGIERERDQNRKEEFRVAGVRTFTLISLLGATAGLIFQYNAMFSVAVFAGVIILVASGYYLSSVRGQSLGQTTEIAELLVFALGYLSFFPATRSISVMIAIVAALTLALKEHIHGFAREIKEYELLDTLKFAVITFIILPILPDQTIDAWGIFNPRQIWLFVVLVSGVSYLGYILIKVLGVNRGSAITGFLGGLSSSTALTTAMARRAKEDHDLLKPSVFAAVIASTVMFPRTLFEIAVLNPGLNDRLIPFALLMFFAGIIASLFIIKPRENITKKIDLKTPFALKPALKFAAILLLILALQHFALQVYGTKGVYLISFFSGLVDVDPVALSSAKMAAEGSLTETVALNSILIAAISNTLMKTFYAYILGGKEFGRLFARAATAIVAAGALSIMLLELGFLH